MQTLKYSLVTLILSLVIISCGGGGSTQTAGIGGTGVTSSGSITGFGSIFVNGVEFDTNDSALQISINGASGKMPADLKLGMVVTVRGSLNSSNNAMGTATNITVDSELEGPIATLQNIDANTDTRSFTVLGQSVLASPSTFYDGGITYSAMNINDVVEVSGFIDNTGVLHATRIEKKGTLVLKTTVVEVKGTVTNLTGTSFTLTVGGNPLTVLHSSFGTDYSGIGGVSALTNGMSIEVKGTLDTASQITASKLESLASMFSSKDSNVELEGIISAYVDNSNFRVNGQLVDASGAGISIPSSLTLANGVQIEVEGTYSSMTKTLTATKIEARDGDIKVTAQVATSGVNSAQKSITLNLGTGTIKVSLNNSSQLEDSTGAMSACANSIFCITDINDGDYLKIEATISNSGTYIVKDLKRKILPTINQDLENKVKGKITNIGGSAGAETLKILGVTFRTDALTAFKINDTLISDKSININRTQFFAQLNTAMQNGTVVVEVKETYTNANGPSGTVTEVDFKM